MLSSLHEVRVPERTAFAAEIGLTGEIRSVPKLEQRVAEVAKLGFRQVYVSASAPPDLITSTNGLRVRPSQSLQDVFSDLFG
jgi:DNA repair protein RadA/Sms